MMKRLILVLAILALTGVRALHGQIACTIDSKGLTTLTWNGVSFLDPAQIGAPLERFTWNPGPSQRSYYRMAITGSSVSGGTANQTYNSGTGDIAHASMVFTCSGATLEIDYSVTNNHATDSLEAEMAPFGLQLPSPAAEYNNNAVLVVSAHRGAGQSFLSGAWGSLAWWTPDIAMPGTEWYAFYNSPSTVLFRPVLQNVQTWGPSETLQTFESYIAPGQTRTWRTFLRFGSAADTALSLVPESYTAFAAATGSLINARDRRPVGNWFVSDASARTASNPRGYNPGTPGFNALDPIAFSAWMSSQTDSVIAHLQALGAQGVVLWDAEGQEFRQSQSYIGSISHLAEFSPEMNAVLDALVARIQAAGFWVGFTIRPQHMLFGTTTPPTCNSGPSGNYNDLLLNTSPYTYPSATRLYRCTAPDAWTAAGNDGANYQTAYLTNAAAGILAKIESEVSAGVTRFHAAAFYVDSVVYEGGPAYQYDIWEQVRTDFPTVQVFPEEVETEHWGFTAPYRQCAGLNNCSTPDEVLNYYPAAFSFVNYNDAANSTNQPTIQVAIERGDIPVVEAWWSNDDQTNLVSYYGAAVAVNSSIVVGGRSFTGTPATTPQCVNAAGANVSCPGYMRLYFAADSAGLSGSTTYCEKKSVVKCWRSGVLQASGTLDLSGFGAYQIAYLYFTGEEASRDPANALNNKRAPHSTASKCKGCVGQ